MADPKKIADCVHRGGDNGACTVLTQQPLLWLLKNPKATGAKLIMNHWKTSWSPDKKREGLCASRKAARHESPKALYVIKHNLSTPGHPGDFHFKGKDPPDGAACYLLKFYLVENVKCGKNAPQPPQTHIQPPFPLTHLLFALRIHGPRPANVTMRGSPCSLQLDPLNPAEAGNSLRRVKHTSNENILGTAEFWSSFRERRPAIKLPCLHRLQQTKNLKG
eukprot:1146900-Pelagomonas_calceolata.AAC.2